MIRYDMKQIIITGLLIIILILSSCGPINRFTRLKQTPREFSKNYCGEPYIAPRNEYSKESWIVFSDRDNNISYQNPGGKVKFKEVGFLQPFFVIKEKGDYLRLVKYDSAIVDNTLFSGKIKDRKKAEYYGWMPKSMLLLSRHSVTDIVTGFKNKQVSIITDTTSLNDPKLFFIQDSARIFKNPNLSSENGKIPLYEILYTLKISQDKNKTLVARKTIISPDSVQTDILGWVPASLIQNVGQVLHVNFRTIPNDSLNFKEKMQKDSLFVNDWSKEESGGISTRNPALKYSPVMSYHKIDSVVSFKTGIPLPVVDQSDNYVFNVNGNKIMYNRFKELEKELRKLNIIFVFEGQQQVFENYPSFVSAIQNLQPKFESDSDIFQYKFSAVWAYQKKSASENDPLVQSITLTDSYTEMVDSLITVADRLKSYKPIALQNTWKGLRRAVEMVEPYQNETNLIVLIGETGPSEWADSLLVRRIANANCRILGYQIHSIEENSGNNFVLQIYDMINNYARWESIDKREKIVYIDQLRQSNLYRESQKNVYALDFPKRSMLQGWICFPEKRVNLPLEILTNSTDTIISEIKWDNNNLVNSLYKAFATVGNHLFKFDSLLVDYNRWDDSRRMLNKEIPKLFQKQLPVWYLPSEKVNLPDSAQKKLDFYLLLSNDELIKILQFMNNLSANEVDYKYQGKSVPKTRMPCNCPDDEKQGMSPVQTDVQGNPKYMGTNTIRKKLKDAYINELKAIKLCNCGAFKKLTLADAQRIITGCPTSNLFLNTERINVLNNKKYISDKKLNDLITYFKQKKEQLDKYLRDPDKFVSNGQTYYWISKKLLP